MAAYQCCADCGEKYGAYRPGAGSHWADTCDVCDADTVVTETRDYVKKVLSNTTNYAAIITGQPQSLKARLGTVGPRNAQAREENTDLP